MCHGGWLRGITHVITEVSGMTHQVGWSYGHIENPQPVFPLSAVVLLEFR